jgi:hypothetical protein
MSTVDEKQNLSPQDNAPHGEDPPRQRSIVDTLFPKEFHAQPEKRGSIVQNEKGMDLPLGNGSDLPPSERKMSVVANTAEDLVTTVIGLEDDPTMSPWTFRTFFLGMLCIRSILRKRSFIYVLQVSDYPVLELSYRRFSTSSHRQSMYR